MKPIEFKEQNVIFAEKQDEYQNLPAHAQGDIITFCNEITDEEFEKIKEAKKIEITILTFNRCPQPLALNTCKPVIPIDHKKTRFNANPCKWDDKKETATFCFELSPMDLNVLESKKEIWISVLTLGTPLFPIQM